MALLFEEKISENKDAFVDKVKAISKDLSIDPNWLMVVMNSESGLKHRIVNKISGATGLIQFMPDTARGLGTTTEKLKAMSNVEQLDYVKKYFQGKTYNSYTDLYAQTFYPVSRNKPDDFILGSERGMDWAKKIAQQNKVIDLNKDGVITAGEFKQWVKSRIPLSALGILEQAVTKSAKFAKRNWIPLTISFVGIGLATYLAIINRDKIIRYFSK